MTKPRPAGMRQVRTQQPLGPKTVVPIDTQVEFRTEQGDIRVSWHRNTGRITIYALGADGVLDQIDVQPVQANVVTVGFTGEVI